MKKLLKILAGLIIAGGTFLLIYPGMPLASWGNAAIGLIKGGATLITFLIGLVLIVMGFSSLRE